MRNIFDTEMEKVRDASFSATIIIIFFLGDRTMNFLYYKMYAVKMHKIDGYKSEKGLLIFTTGKSIRFFLSMIRKQLIKNLAICVRL